MSVVRWWVVVWYPPAGVCARCRGHRPPLGSGMKRPVASPPLHNSPPGAARPLAPAGVGGGALGAVRGPSALLAARTACIAVHGRRGLEPHVRAAPPQLGWGSGGGTGFSVWGDRSPAGHTTLHVGVTALGFLGPVQGSGGPTQGPLAPPVRSLCVRHGRGEGTKATRGHDAWCVGREV